jgi:hypothetical protein
MLMDLRTFKRSLANRDYTTTVLRTMLNSTIAFLVLVNIGNSTRNLEHSNIMLTDAHQVEYAHRTPSRQSQPA